MALVFGPRWPYDLINNTNSTTLLRGNRSICVAWRAPTFSRGQRKYYKKRRYTERMRDRLFTTPVIRVAPATHMSHGRRTHGAPHGRRHGPAT